MRDVKWMKHPIIDRTPPDTELADEIKSLVDRYGLHTKAVIFGNRCCTDDELDAAIAHEIKQRREHNSTGMVVTTGRGASPAGVFLPPAPTPVK